MSKIFNSVFKTVGLMFIGAVLYEAARQSAEDSKLEEKRLKKEIKKNKKNTN